MLTLQRIIHKPETINDEEKIAVCKFAKDVVPEEGNAEITMDGKKLIIIIYQFIYEVYNKKKIFMFII